MNQNSRLLQIELTSKIDGKKTLFDFSHEDDLNKVARTLKYISVYLLEDSCDVKYCYEKEGQDELC